MNLLPRPDKLLSDRLALLTLLTMISLKVIQSSLYFHFSPTIAWLQKKNTHKNRAILSTVNPIPYDLHACALPSLPSIHHGNITLSPAPQRLGDLVLAGVRHLLRRRVWREVRGDPKLLHEVMEQLMLSLPKARTIC